MKKLRLAVLVSGGGTNLQSLIDKSLENTVNAEICVVLSDKSDAYGLERAKQAKIPSFHVDYKAQLQKAVLEGPNWFPVDLDELNSCQNIIKKGSIFDQKRKLARLVIAEMELIRIIEQYQVDYVCLAGYMRLVSPYFIRHFNHDKMKVINIHPALLPSFPGTHGYEDTFNYGCRWGGITVHFVDEGEDTGPIIAQGIYPIWPGDELQTIKKRGLELEYKIYAQVINWLSKDMIEIIEVNDKVKIKIKDPLYQSIVKEWTTTTFLR